MPFDLSNYVEVADRITEWYRLHPEGRIETLIVDDLPDRITVRAVVYRDGEHEPAGTGHSWLAIPGTTPYTQGSELENAETSAVGRALVFAGIPSKHVASVQEVSAKRGAPKAAPQPPAEGGGGHRSAAGGTPEGGGAVRGSVALPPDGDPLTGDLFVEALQVAVAKLGNLNKVVVAARKLDPKVRSEADLLGWHLVEIAERR